MSGNTLRQSAIDSDESGSTASSPRPLFVSEVRAIRRQSNGSATERAGSADTANIDAPSLRVQPITPLALFTRNIAVASPRLPHATHRQARDTESDESAQAPTEQNVNKESGLVASTKQFLRNSAARLKQPRVKTPPVTPRAVSSEPIVMSHSSDVAAAAAATMCSVMQGTISFGEENPLLSLQLPDFSSDSESSDGYKLSHSSGSSGSEKIARRRTRMLAKATAGAATSYGASAQIEFDQRTRQPLVRVRSHSSVDELKRQLRLPAVIRENDIAVSDSRALLRRKTPTSLHETKFTKIVFNVDPFAAVPWDVYIVPDSEITLTMRTYLIAAHNSDQLDPYRLCNCRAREDKECTEHAMPDVAAKFFGCYMLNAGVATRGDVHVRALVANYLERKIITSPNAWAKYKVLDGRPAALEALTLSHEYKFRMFF